MQRNNLKDKIYFDINSNVLQVRNVRNETFVLQFNKDMPEKFTINIINSEVTIIERYQGNNQKYQIKYKINKKSKLTRLGFILQGNKDIAVNRTIINKGVYSSYQIDLADNNNENIEQIDLIADQANCLIYAGIFNKQENTKNYKTVVNHLATNSVSKIEIFAINRDKAHVSIYTDAYIRKGAVNSNATQQGRIINLNAECSGIVLPNLHIDENDVLASHSCSVGSVNNDHLYYLKSRGLSEASATNLLILGYFTPILLAINDSKIRKEIEKALYERID